MPVAVAARAQAAHANPPAAVTVSHQVETALAPITVHGNKLYLPVALQMIKAALHRPVNFQHENYDKLVCQFADITGTHFRTLDCRTNCQRLIQSEAAQGFIISSQICASGRSVAGSTGVLIGNWADQQRINPGALRALLKKLPPADSSYTLRITNHGKVVAEYVFKKGVLVSVRESKHKPKQ